MNMNKKSIITILLALVAVAGQAKKTIVWEKPAAFMGTYNSTFEITKVELKQTETTARSTPSRMEKRPTNRS